MARLLNGTTSQYLNVLTGEAIPYPLSVSCQIKITASTNGIPFTYGEGLPEWDGDYSGAATSGVSATSGKGASWMGTTAVGPLTPGQWYLLVAVYTSSAERRVYLSSSTQTAVDFSPQAVVGHTNKNLTLGGVLTTAGLHVPAGYNGEIADVAIWNTALTAADVDALAAGRPGTVKPANLKAWYKLGADGSLASSVGTYPAMTVFGTVPAVADPVYPAVPALPVMVEARQEISPLDPEAPNVDDLIMWYPATRPFTDYWSNKAGWAQAVPYIIAPSHEPNFYLEGDDNSLARTSIATDCSMQCDYIPNNAAPNYLGRAQTLMAWIKVKNFQSFAGPYWQQVNVMTGQVINAYWWNLGYWSQAAYWYGVDQTIQFQRVSAYSSVAFGGPKIQPDEWAHIAISCDTEIETFSVYLNGVPYILNYYQGGQIRPDMWWTPWVWCHGHSGGYWDWGNYQAKDFRIYGKALNPEEMAVVYRQSMDFREASSGLLVPVVSAGSIGVPEPPEPPAGSDPSGGHHILGAM